MPTLIIRDRNGLVLNRIVLTQRHCNLGKGEDNAVVLKGWLIQRQHCLFEQDCDGWRLVPVGHAVVRINGKRIDSAQTLCAGDVIQIGPYRLDLDSSGGAVAERDPAFQKDLPEQAKPSVIETAVQPVISSSQITSQQHVSEGTQRNAAEIRRFQIEAHQGLIRFLERRRIDVNTMAEDELWTQTPFWISEVIDELGDLPAGLDRALLQQRVLDEALGLGPLEVLLSDPEVTEIMVNAHDQIFFEKAGKLQRSEVEFSDKQAVISAIERIVAPLGRRIDESSPMVDARLKDGSRVNAVIPPLALKGPCITIRKFPERNLSCEDLCGFNSMNAAMSDFLELIVRQKQNIVISGGTGSGKTTLLNVLSAAIPSSERIVTVEDAAELRLNQPNLVSLEARPCNQEGKGAVTIRELVRNCLRMRPDRIVVGECRGGEALDMLQAMNTGHDGSLTTAHANTPRDCLSRIEVMVMMADMAMPMQAIREQICSAVKYIVQQTRFPCGSRKITSISEVCGIEQGVVQLAEIFRFQQTGYDESGKVQGAFLATGIVPELCDGLRSRGIKVDMGMFGTSEAAA